MCVARDSSAISDVVNKILGSVVGVVREKNMGPDVLLSDAWWSEAFLAPPVDHVREDERLPLQLIARGYCYGGLGGQAGRAGFVPRSDERCLP